MKKRIFTTPINASKERVWDSLWEDQNYRYWTSVFAECSSAESDWQEGSKILFLDGKGMGMTSKIARKIPYEFMSFQHLGYIKDGVEDFAIAEAKGWAGALENYTLREENGITTLTVELDNDEEHAGYFQDTFPKALEKVKELAERQI